MTTIAWFSCDAKVRPLWCAETIINNADVVVVQGDTPYCNTGSTGWGFSSTGVTMASTVNDFLTHYNLQFAKDGWRELLASSLHKYFIPDDHEWGGDNWDHTLSRANLTDSIGAVDQADVGAHFSVGVQAINQVIANHFDNPVNDHVLAVAELPSKQLELAPGTALTAYEPRYFREYFDASGNKLTDATGAHVVMYVLDPITYRTPITAPDSASKTIYGANQKAWFKSATLEDKTIPLRAYMFSKRFYLDVGNGDTFAEYPTERTEILAYLDTNGIAGGVWLGGDQHRAHVTATRKAAGDTYDHLFVCACPVGVDANASTMAAGAGNNVWVDNNPADDDYSNVYGLATALADRWVVKIMPLNGAAPRWQGEVLAGSNALTYPDIAVAV